MDSGSKICFIGIFAVGFMKDYGRGNQFGKVVHDESGKNLLVYVLQLFCVKMEQSDGIFEFPEGSFNAPTHGIKFFELLRRKSIGIQIGHNCFAGIFCDLEAEDAKRKLVKQ